MKACPEFENGRAVNTVAVKMASLPISTQTRPATSSRNHHFPAFTLIELLVVIAIYRDPRQLSVAGVGESERKSQARLVPVQP